MANPLVVSQIALRQSEASLSFITYHDSNYFHHLAAAISMLKLVG